jgi:hypothetical protein
MHDFKGRMSNLICIKIRSKSIWLVFINLLLPHTHTLAVKSISLYLRFSDSKWYNILCNNIVMEQREPLEVYHVFHLFPQFPVFDMSPSGSLILWPRAKRSWAKKPSEWSLSFDLPQTRVENKASFLKAWRGHCPKTQTGSMYWH